MVLLIGSTATLPSSPATYPKLKNITRQPSSNTIKTPFCLQTELWLEFNWKSISKPLKIAKLPSKWSLISSKRKYCWPGRFRPAASIRRPWTCWTWQRTRRESFTPTTWNSKTLSPLTDSNLLLRQRCISWINREIDHLFINCEANEMTRPH